MQKPITILLLSIYLLAYTQVGQIFKLPILVQHFQTHKAINNNISFLEFIEMHYAHGDIKDADYDEDMKLPFKTDNNLNQSVLYNFVYEPYSIVDKKVALKAKSVYPLKQSFHFSSPHLAAIWQPPKFC